MALSSSCRENGEIIINSGNRLTVETAGDFLQLVRETLDASKSVAIEFEAVVEIDITGVQIICSACKSAAAGGKSFSCQGPQPQGLADIINAYGAGHYAACNYNNDSTCIWFGSAK
jgi:anti-anti-sigma regulatory factor